MQGHGAGSKGTVAGSVGARFHEASDGWGRLFLVWKWTVWGVWAVVGTWAGVTRAASAVVKLAFGACNVHESVPCLE